MALIREARLPTPLGARASCTHAAMWPISGMRESRLRPHCEDVSPTIQVNGELCIYQIW